MQSVALGWLLYRLTHSPFLLGPGRLPDPDPEPGPLAGGRGVGRPLEPAPDGDRDPGPGHGPGAGPGRPGDLAARGRGGHPPAQLLPRAGERRRRAGPAVVHGGDGVRERRPPQRHRPQLVGLQPGPPGGPLAGGPAARARRGGDRVPPERPELPGGHRRAARHPRAGEPAPGARRGGAAGATCATASLRGRLLAHPLRAVAPGHGEPLRHAGHRAPAHLRGRRPSRRRPHLRLPGRGHRRGRPGGRALHGLAAHAWWGWGG